MDVRLKLAADASRSSQEIVTGLPDGTLRSLFNTLSARHPEVTSAVHDETINLELVEILVNNRRLEHATLRDYALKDGDTVSLLIHPHD